tara:strand:+ start:1664 stop:1834 length:171 start_codon:yes stop_codon:yes gene_type:complete
MAGFTYTTLKAAILNYTETDANVLTTTIVDQFIENAEFRIFYDVLAIIIDMLVKEI